MSSQLVRGEDRVGIVKLDSAMFGLPGDAEGGMSGRNRQRKLGTTRGHIAYKPLCGEIAMCPRVGRMGSIK